MKSLAERHEDRAKRKFENAAESTHGDAGGNIANAAYLMEKAQEAFAGLTEEQRAELRAAYEGSDMSLDNRSLAEDDSGNFKYAGIGVVNPLVVPPSDYPAQVSLSEIAARAGNGGGWVGNANGRAIDDALAQAGASSGTDTDSGVSEVQGNGWGGEPAPVEQEAEKVEPAAKTKATKPN